MSARADLTSLDPQAKTIVAKYDRPHAAVLTLLHLAQEAIGHVTPEAEEWVARWTQVPVVHVHEVVTFYSMYHRKPVGRHHIRCCTGTSCVLRDGERVFDYLKKKLRIDKGGVTEDGRFSLEEAECLCACETAPMMQVGGDYHGDLTEEKVDRILGGLK